MQRLSKESEDRILSVIDQAVDLVEQGQHPDEAIAKAASDQQLPHGHVRLVVQSYNTGKTNEHRRSNTDLWDKVASFPLATTANVVERMFPTAKSAWHEVHGTAVAEEYDSPPSWLGDLEPRPQADLRAGLGLPETPVELPVYQERVLKKAESDRQRKRWAADEAGVRRTSAKLAADRALDELRSYFRTPGHIPFGEVIENVNDRAAELLNKVADELPKLKKEETRRYPAPAIGGPYTLLNTLVKCAAEVAEAEKALKEATDALEPVMQFAELKKQRTHPILGDLSEAETPEPEEDEREVMTGSVLNPVPMKLKSAEDKKPSMNWLSTGKSILGKPSVEGFLSGTKGILGPMAKGTGWLKDKTNNEALIRKQFAGLEDPIHEATLSKIRSEAMLNDVIANDEVISGYDPQEIISMYNDLSATAPRLSKNPMAVRALLRKLLSQGGQIDPFDVDQIARMENQIKMRDEPDYRQATLPHLNGVKH